MSEQPHDPPFKLPLRAGFKPDVAQCEYAIFDADNNFIAGTETQAMTETVARCIAAHDRLAEYTRRYRTVCEVQRLTTEENELDVLAYSWADDIREIDAALAGTKEP